MSPGNRTSASAGTGHDGRDSVSLTQKKRQFEVTCFDELAAFVATLLPGTELRVRLVRKPNRRAYFGGDGKRHTTMRRIAATVDVLADPDIDIVILKILTSSPSDVLMV